MLKQSDDAQWTEKRDKIRTVFIAGRKKIQRVWKRGDKTP
jgi:hypothetical protein